MGVENISSPFCAQDNFDCFVAICRQMTLYLLAYHHSDMQALAVELASTAAMLVFGWVIGCVRACMHVMVLGASRGLHICSHLGSSWVTAYQLLNNQGKIESETVIVATKNLMQ